MQIQANPSKSKQIQANPSKSKQIQANPSKSKQILRISLFSLFVIHTFLFPIASFSYNNKYYPKKPTKDSSKPYIGITGGLLFNFPTAEVINGDKLSLLMTSNTDLNLWDMPKTRLSITGELALKFYYPFLEEWSFVPGVAYQRKNFKIYWKKKDATQDFKSTIDTKFINLSLGIRNETLSPFIIGFGGFYALKIGSWNFTNEYQMYGLPASNKIEIEKKNISNDYGFYVETGLTVFKSTNTSKNSNYSGLFSAIDKIQLLVGYEKGFAPIYKSDDKIIRKIKSNSFKIIIEILFGL